MLSFTSFTKLFLIKLAVVFSNSRPFSNHFFKLAIYLVDLKIAVGLSGDLILFPGTVSISISNTDPSS